MKKIEIHGQKNINKLNPQNTEKKARKALAQLDDNYFIQENQIKMINQLYLNQEFDGRKHMEKELCKKINGYKQQDVSKKVYEHDLFISLDEIVECLVLSKMKCYYCKHNMDIFYKNVREPYQWTLDRIDNDKGHYRDNIVISCLECNLKRRKQNSEAFLFTKQLRIVKTD
jgi:hypothetical protein